jgi:hypothetical protein
LAGAIVSVNICVDVFKLLASWGVIVVFLAHHHAGLGTEVDRNTENYDKHKHL